MRLHRGRPPVWIMGMANGTFGMYLGFVAISLPQLLAEQHLSVVRVTAVTALVYSPLFWSFLVSPLLDVRFSRRCHAAGFAVLAAVLLAAGVWNLHRLAVMEAALVAGVAAVNLSSCALFGWLASVLPKEEETRLSAWANVANIGGSGVMVVAAGELIQRLPLRVAALGLGVLVLLPVTAFAWIPAPRGDRKLTRESFAGFFRELVLLLGERRVLVALAMFALPSASFALANVIGGLGDVYSTPVHTVSLVGGVGIVLAGMVGSLGYPPLTRWLALRPLYLAIGLVGAVLTLGLLLLPHTATGFVVATLSENSFQALAITGAYAIQFETVGQDNPLAATTFSVLNAAMNVSIFYMIAVDGWAYGRGGLAGCYGADAGISTAACVLMGTLLLWLRWRSGAGSERGRA